VIVEVLSFYRLHADQYGTVYPMLWIFFFWSLIRLQDSATVPVQAVTIDCISHYCTLHWHYVGANDMQVNKRDKQLW